MNEKISIKRNFMMNIILTISSFIFPLISFPYVSRVLQPEGIGKVNLANSLVSYFLIVAQLGIPTYGIRATAQVRDDTKKLSKVSQELLTINLVMCAIAYILLIATVLITPKFSSEKILYFISSATLFFDAIGMEWLYKGLEQYSYITKRSVLFKFIALVLMFALVKTKSDYVIYCAITIFATSASYVLNFIHARKYISFKHVRHLELRKHLKSVGVFFAMTCAVTAYVNLDTLMLGIMKTDAEVGYYSTGVKIRTILLSVAVSLGTVLLPRTSYYYKNGQIKEFSRINKKALNFTILLASSLAVYFIQMAADTVYVISGPAYTRSILPLQVILPTVLIAGISNVTGLEILIPEGREKIVLYSEITGAVVDLVINSILIPPLGGVGAAIGTLAAEIAVLGVQVFSDPKQFHELFSGLSYVKIILADIFATLSILWIHAWNVVPFVRLLVSCIVFFCIYGLSLYLLKEPLFRELFDEVIGKLRKAKHD